MVTSVEFICQYCTFLPLQFARIGCFALEQPGSLRQGNLVKAFRPVVDFHPMLPEVTAKPGLPVLNDVLFLRCWTPWLLAAW